MANSPQSKKRARQNPKRRLHNAGLRSAMRTAIKQFKAEISLHSDDKTARKPDFKRAQSNIDKAVSKGIVHKKNASRLKKRLYALARASA